MTGFEVGAFINVRALGAISAVTMVTLTRV